MVGLGSVVLAAIPIKIIIMERANCNKAPRRPRAVMDCCNQSFISTVSLDVGCGLANRDLLYWCVLGVVLAIGDT